MVKAEALDDATLVVTFAEKRARDVPLYVATLPIFSKAYYATRPFDESTLDIPLGSGPYKVGKFEANRYIEYDRVKDWWGADLPVSRGHFNFDVVRLRVLSRPRRRLRGLHRQELSVPRGIHLADLGDALRLPRRQGWPRQARDRARRDAGGRAGLVHEHPPRAVQGSARARGADLCVRFRMDQQDHHVRRLCAHHFAVPEFGHGGDRVRRRRKNSSCSSRSAARCRTRCSASRSCRRCPTDRGRTARCCARPRSCCTDAGLVVKDGKRLLPDGEVFKIEFLLDEPSFQPHHAPFIKNLGTLGIEATLRLVDAVQYRARRRGFRFRHDHRALSHIGDAGRLDAADLLLAGGRDQGLLQSGRHRRSRRSMR